MFGFDLLSLFWWGGWPNRPIRYSIRSQLIDTASQHSLGEENQSNKDVVDRHFLHPMCTAGVG